MVRAHEVALVWIKPGRVPFLKITARNLLKARGNMVHARKISRDLCISPLISTYEQTVPTACVTANLFSFVYPTQTKSIQSKLKSNGLTHIKLIKTRLGTAVTPNSQPLLLNRVPAWLGGFGPIRSHYHVHLVDN